MPGVPTAYFTPYKLQIYAFFPRFQLRFGETSGPLACSVPDAQPILWLFWLLRKCFYSPLRPRGWPGTRRENSFYYSWKGDVRPGAVIGLGAGKYLRFALPLFNIPLW